jgi:hypothetical protein
MRNRILVLLALAFSLTAAAQTAPRASAAWRALQALQGTWNSEPGPTPAGPVTGGGFTITAELQGQVLVRRSFTEFAASAARPAFRHDDLTVYSAGEAPRAIYFDSEGHTIEYASITVSADGKQIVCVSAVKPNEPRFRFTYTFTSPDSMKVGFDIAMPGAPEQFGNHVGGVVHRVASH